MSQRVDTLDLETLNLRPGEGRRIDASVRVEPLSSPASPTRVEDGAVEARLDISRTVSGYALRLRFEAPLDGACMRCMAEARPVRGRRP